RSRALRAPPRSARFPSSGASSATATAPMDCQVVSTCEPWSWAALTASPPTAPSDATALATSVADTEVRSTELKADIPPSHRAKEATARRSERRSRWGGAEDAGDGGSEVTAMLSLYGGAPGGHLPQPLTDLQESLHHSRRIPEAPSPPRTPWTETVCTRCSSPIWWPLWWGRSWFGR